MNRLPMRLFASFMHVALAEFFLYYVIHGIPGVLLLAFRCCIHLVISSTTLLERYPTILSAQVMCLYTLHSTHH